MKIIGLNIDLAKYFGVIYCIKILKNNKCYIGQTWSLIKRIQHYRTLRCKDQPKIYNALKKYGINLNSKECIDIEFIILDICENQIEMDKKEIWYINEYDSMKNGYNLKEGGSYGRHTPETIAKIKETRIKNGGYIVTEDQRKRFIERITGKPLTKQAKEKMSLVRKGIKKSEETKRKMKEYHQKRSELIKLGLLIVKRSKESIDKQKATLAKKKLNI